MSLEEQLGLLVEGFAPGSRLLGVWPLPGGVSAHATAFEIERPDGGTEKLVMRRHGTRELSREPQIAADEFALLQVLHEAGVAVPKPRHFDASGDIFPMPCLILDHVEGQTDLRPRDLDDYYLARIAAWLAELHSFDTDRVAFLRRTEASTIGVDPSCLTGAAAVTLHRMPPPAQVNRSVLLHGDFWPGNILWRDGQPIAVIDWEDASIGIRSSISV